MTLQTMPVDTAELEFRYHGASEYKAFNPDTDKKEDFQARDEDTGYPIYTVRCQVLFRDVRQSGMITVRVPLPEPPAETIDFEHPVTFSGVPLEDMEPERSRRPDMDRQDHGRAPRHKPAINTGNE